MQAQVAGPGMVSADKELSYKKGKLLYKDDFDPALKNWVAEFPAKQGSGVAGKKGKLIIDVQDGATVWFTKKLSGNILIEYTRTVIIKGGMNDRLSDLNQFWMATDPANENLFTRKGAFSEYDSLLLYYVGMGGNTNTTTRFRKYTGNGERILYGDFTGKEHLLQPNKEYRIKTVVYKGFVQFFVNGSRFFSFRDPEPLHDGYFGFRTTQSRQEISDFRVFALE